MGSIEQQIAFLLEWHILPIGQRSTAVAFVPVTTLNKEYIACSSHVFRWLLRLRLILVTTTTFQKHPYDNSSFGFERKVKSQ